MRPRREPRCRWRLKSLSALLAISVVVSPNILFRTNRAHAIAIALPAAAVIAFGVGMFVTLFVQSWLQNNHQTVEELAEEAQRRALRVVREENAALVEPAKKAFARALNQVMPKLILRIPEQIGR